jgi:ribA/ribD-fused uncharacterized protein
LAAVVYFIISYHFCNAPFSFDGNTFANVEQAFQFMKIAPRNEKWQRDILNAATPAIAKSLGRRCPIRTDWNTVKDDIMHSLVLAKFEQNADSRDKLLATGNAYLEEANTWGDKYWGTCNGVGENRLGQILMSVRDELTKKIQCVGHGILPSF